MEKNIISEMNQEVQNHILTSSEALSLKLSSKCGVLKGSFIGLAFQSRIPGVEVTDFSAFFKYLENRLAEIEKDF